MRTNAIKLTVTIHNCFVNAAENKNSNNNPLQHVLLLLLLSSSSSFLCRVFILIFPRKTSVTAILLLLFMVLISSVSVLNLLYFYISTFRSMCAVLNMAVFWSSLTSCFPGMLLTYFLNDFETVPVAPIINGITHYYLIWMSLVTGFFFPVLLLNQQ